uniref:Uncharacterized protein n=1 Tax=Anguilla anguilla TaxID=7936 RepID=A0A0E9X946_ANGAN
MEHQERISSESTGLGIVSQNVKWLITASCGQLGILFFGVESNRALYCLCLEFGRCAIYGVRNPDTSDRNRNNNNDDNNNKNSNYKNRVPALCA